MKNHLVLFSIFLSVQCITQDVGIQTLTPDAPLHLYSNGQVYTPGGLFLLGDRANGNLELDFNTIQAYFNASTEDLRIQPAGGNVGINIPFPSAVDFALQVNGHVGINNFITHVGDTDTYFSFASDDIRLSAGGMENLIVQQADVRMGGNTVFVDTDLDMVGIGTTSPDFTLDVVGDIGIDANITHNGDEDTEFQFSDDRIIAKVGGNSFLTMTEGANSSLIMGDGSDIDLYLNGLMYLDGGTERIGINESNPSSMLTINTPVGEEAFRLKFDGVSEVIVDDAGQMGLGDLTPSARLEIDSDAAETALRVKVDGSIELIVASDGQVGIGDSSPSAKLNIDSDAGEDPFRVQLNGSTKLFVNDNGFIGAGGTGFFTPATDLHVRHPASSSATGGISVENSTSSRWQFWVANDGNFYLFADGTFMGAFVNGTGDWSPISDQNAKRNIHALPTIMDRVMQLTPSSYQLKTEAEGAIPQYGFIAQEVEKLFPENVRRLNDLDKKIVLYKGMSVVAIKAIQEQQGQIDALQAENDDLRNRLERLESLLLKK